MSYQGFENWETWNLALHVNNTYAHYELMRKARPFTADTARVFCKQRFGAHTPDGANLSAVNWNDIAEDFNAE